MTVPNKQVLKTFNTPFFPDVLIATSVLQEGVNLQYFCKKVYHYGIAWTPGDNEQRVGRVDRMFGQIERELKKNSNETLDILYPYLKGSFDEEQVAGFIKKKHENEALIDKCLSTDFDKEVRIEDNLNSKWQNYLRYPDQKSRNQSDPYPAKNFPDKENIKIEDNHSDIKTFITNLQRKIKNIAKCEVYNLWDEKKPSNNICLIDPKVNHGRNQPVIVDINFSSELSGLIKGTVYYITLRSPLAKKENKYIYKVNAEYENISDKYKLVKLCLDEKSEESYFYMYTRVDLPLFRGKDQEDYLHEDEIKEAYQQLIELTDKLELEKLGNQDISRDDLKMEQLNRKVETSQFDPRKKANYIPKNWKVKDNKIIYLKKVFCDSVQKKNPLIENHNTPFIQCKDAFIQCKGKEITLPYMVIDLQKEELDILEKWFSFKTGNLKIKE